VAIHITYSQARARFAALWDEAIDNREVIIIQRRGAPDVAMIAADELSGLFETVHLLKSPANAERLLSAMERMRRE
jgi:antitoxin YefM